MTRLVVVMGLGPSREQLAQQQLQQVRWFSNGVLHDFNVAEVSFPAWGYDEAMYGYKG